MTDLETRVHRFVADRLGVPSHRLTRATTLFGDLGVDGDDAAELLEAFGEAFGIDPTDLELARHFGPEGLWPWTVAEWLRQAARSGTREDRAGLRPITLGDLARAARDGRWTFEGAEAERPGEGMRNVDESGDVETT